MLETIIQQPHIRLRLLREAFTLNKTQFAKILETPYRTYQKWEYNDKRLSFKATNNMIKLGINPNFINGDDQPILNCITFEQVKINIINSMIKKGIN